MEGNVKDDEEHNKNFDPVCAKALSINDFDERDQRHCF